MTLMNRLSEGLNAFRVTFDDALLRDIRDDYRQHLAPYLNHSNQRPLFEGGDLVSMPVPGDADDYYIKSFREYPLLWISGNNDRTHQMFERLFESLGLASEVEKLVDFDRRIVVNSGFLVVGDRAPEPRWHVDYYPFANAFTLITREDESMDCHSMSSLVPTENTGMRHELFTELMLALNCCFT